MAGEEIFAAATSANAGADGGGGTAVAEEPIEGAAPPAEGEQPSGDTSAEGDHPAGEEPLPGEPEGETGEFERDGRTMDKATQKAIAALKKVDPQAAKAAADAYFANKAILKEFPDAKSVTEVLRSVRNMKATLESLGGEQGIEEMQSEIADYNKEIGQFAQGDKQFLYDLYGPNGEGAPAFRTAVVNSMDVLAEKNPEQFTQVLTPHLFKAIERSPLRATLSKVVEFLEQGDKGQEIYNELRKIGQWYSQLDADAKKANENKTAAPDPRDEAHRRREEELTNRENESFRNNINSEVTKVNNVALDKITRELFNSLKLDQDGRRQFVQNLMHRVWERMKADKSYLRNAQSKMGRKDSGATALITDKFAEFLPEEFRKLRNSMYPHIPTRRAGEPAPKPGNKSGAAPSSAAVLVPKPPANQIDWGKTTDVMFNQGGKFGEAILLPEFGGKRVKFDWSKV